MSGEWVELGILMQPLVFFTPFRSSHASFIHRGLNFCSNSLKLLEALVECLKSNCFAVSVRVTSPRLDSLLPSFKRIWLAVPTWQSRSIFLIPTVLAVNHSACSQLSPGVLPLEGSRSLSSATGPRISLNLWTSPLYQINPLISFLSLRPRVS